MILKGKNGSGKSSLLKVLAGIVPPNEGRVEWNGECIRNHPHFNANVAYLGHRLALQFHMTVSEILGFWARLYDRTELLPAALHYFDLTAYQDMPCEVLSAGWKQRVALARLILSPAKLWLLDEPASHLDDTGLGLMESLIAARKEQGGMVVMSYHGAVGSEHVREINIDDYK